MAQSSLLGTLTPEIEGLFDRIERELEKMARREQALIARCELQEGRLSSRASLASSSKNNREGGRAGKVAKADGARSDRGREDEEGGGYASGEGVGTEDEEEAEEEESVEQGREALRLKQMRQKKERLSYAVERLTLQAQQRERQLRMSMAGHAGQPAG